MAGWVRAYGGAVLATAAGLILRFVLAPLLGTSVPYITFFPAIVASAAYGGLGPGLATTILSALAAFYFIVPPLHSVYPRTTEDALGLVVFLFVGASLSLMQRALRQVRTAEQNGRLRY